MTTNISPLELGAGTDVRVLGRYSKRRVTMRLDRPPVLTEATKHSAAAVCLCGYQRTSGPTGNTRRFVVRFVEVDELVEVLS